MSDQNMYREEARPTLPSVRDLFRDELSRTPRPPTNPTPPWIIPGPQNFDRPYSRADHRQDRQLDGPGVQRSVPSTTYYSPPPQHRSDGRAGSRPPPPDNLSSSMTQYHSQLSPQYHARSTSQADQLNASHDQSTPPGSRPYLNMATSSYNYTYPTTGASSRGSGSYAEGSARDQYRESMVAAEGVRQPSVPQPSSLKYECDYCGKGFTRPSSLRIHLNSHTGEKREYHHSHAASQMLTLEL
ncbi:hypothetical protein JVU11DRAFT_2416 [Chiua virens]|nr:hypothetical protein JVU11DRAFT_2416 [Chiua virens]